MRLAQAYCSVSIALVLSGCASRPGPASAPGLPPTVEGGLGSQYGNYAAQIAGEIRGPTGERCVIYDWDRPFSNEMALRLRSASCESPERPGWMVARELSRTLIPIAESNLKGGHRDEDGH
jgi:hypothetical protein